jgi:hypothetical protein
MRAHAHDWLVAKHYDLRSTAEFDAILAEIVSLLRKGAVPSGALTSWLSRGQ